MAKRLGACNSYLVLTHCTHFLCACLSCSWDAKERARPQGPGCHLHPAPGASSKHRRVALSSLPLVIMLTGREMRTSHTFHTGFLFPISLCWNGEKDEQKVDFHDRGREGNNMHLFPHPHLGTAPFARREARMWGRKSSRSSDSSERVAFLLSVAGRRGSISPLKGCWRVPWTSRVLNTESNR